MKKYFISAALFIPMITACADGINAINAAVKKVDFLAFKADDKIAESIESLSFKMKPLSTSEMILFLSRFNSSEDRKDFWRLKYESSENLFTQLPEVSEKRHKIFQDIEAKYPINECNRISNRLLRKYQEGESYKTLAKATILISCAVDQDNCVDLFTDDESRKELGKMFNEIPNATQREMDEISRELDMCQAQLNQKEIRAAYDKAENLMYSQCVKGQWFSHFSGNDLNHICRETSKTNSLDRFISIYLSEKL